MAAAYRTHVASGIADGGSTTYDSASITTTAGDTLYVYVVSSDSSPVAPSGVVWNPGGSNQSLTNIKAHQVYGTYYGASLWRLVSPTAGTGVVRATWPSGQAERLLIVVAASDVDSTTPNGTIGQGLDATGTTFSVSGTATTTSGQTVLAFASLGSSGEQFAFGSPSGTERVEASTSGTPYDTAAMQDTVASGASTTMTWSITPTSGTHPPWLIWVVPLNDAASSPPAAPTIGTTTAISNTGATINWTDNSADETGFKVEWSPSPYSSWTPASNSPAAANATSLAITGLTAATTYKARVASTNANGDSAWVETATFTTTNTVKKLKLKIDASAAGATGISGVVWAAQVGAIAGAEIGEFTGQTFEAALEGGQAVLKVPVSAFGGGSLTVSDTPVALVRNATNTSGIVSCTVIEE